VIVSKKVSFDAAHHLPLIQGPCHRLHGHHWVAEIGVDGEVKDDGMVVDFAILKHWMNQNIVEVFDHTLINDVMINPTAENIAGFIADNFKKTFTLKLAFVRVWETENSCVEWRSE